MVKKDKDIRNKESPLAAVLIKEGEKIYIISPVAQYFITSKGSLDVKPVEDYEACVKERLDEISRRIGTGYFSGNIQIDYSGVDKSILLNNRK